MPIEESHLRKLRKAKKLTLEQVAERAGLTKSGLTMIETGQRGLHDRNIPQLADALGVTIGELFGEAGATPLVAVTHILTSGDRIVALPVGEPPQLVNAPRPLTSDATCAIVVRDANLPLPVTEGWIIYYDKPQEDVIPPECIGYWTVCCLASGEMFLKVPQLGSRPGYYVLMSPPPTMATPMIDQKLRWASPVRGMFAPA